MVDYKNRGDGMAEEQKAEDQKCDFCEIGKKGLLEMLPPENGKPVPCKRGIYEDEHCIATLAPEQYTEGHALVILKNHRENITDENLSSEELLGVMNAIYRVSRNLKEYKREKDGETPDKIYVCSLCDGVNHLHFHLIPRYPFSDEDINYYREHFEKRDGKEKVEQKIKTGELGGFWYIAKREEEYKESDYFKKEDNERAKELEVLAKKLRMTII